jgi:hypothetical protein
MVAVHLCVCVCVWWWWLQGKPGWITYTESSEIAFDLNFERGDLVVGYLRSYANLGGVDVWVTEPAGSVDPGGLPQPSGPFAGPGRLGPTSVGMLASPMRLEGLWEDHKSELSKHQISGVGRGRLRVHLRAVRLEQGSKFKLLLLMSC